MSRALYILDPQVGFDHESVHQIFNPILEFARDFPGEIMISMLGDAAGNGPGGFDEELNS